MIKQRLSLVLIVLLLVSCTVFSPPTNMLVGEGNTYYVSKTGNDNNSGTLSSPWLTIKYAIQNLSFGDTLYIRDGIYQESFNISANGTATSPITIESYPNETAIIDGNNWAFPGTGGFLIDVSGNYIHLSNLEIRYSGYGGVLVDGSYNIVDNVYVHHDWYNGIYVSGWYGAHDNIVKNSRVFSNSMINENNNEIYGTSSGLTVAHQAKNTILRNNEVWQNWGEGLSVYTTEGPNTVENNIIHDNITNVYISDADYTLVQRNLVYADPTSPQYPYRVYGINMGDEQYSTYGNSHNNTIINNILYGNYYNIYWWNANTPQALVNCTIAYNTSVNSYGGGGEITIAAPMNGGVHFGNVIQNNILRTDSASPVIVIGSTTGITLGYNLFSKAPPTYAQGIGDIVGNPNLMETDTYKNPLWYKLKSSSPAINNGKTMTQVGIDYWSIQRDSSPDIGANEYIQLIPTKTPSKTITPAPTYTKTATITPRITLETATPTIVATPVCRHKFLWWCLRWK